MRHKFSGDACRSLSNLKYLYQVRLPDELIQIKLIDDLFLCK